MTAPAATAFTAAADEFVIQLAQERGLLRAAQLDAARARPFAFGRYAGLSVGEVGLRDPGYLAWCIDNVRRDPELVQAAERVLTQLMEEYGLERPPRGSLRRPSPVGFDGVGD